MTTVTFWVPGQPRPGGSKTAQVVMRKGGVPVMVTTKTGKQRPLVTIRDDAKGNKDWKNNVAFSARQAIGHGALPFPDGALQAIVTFFVQRPRAHFRKSGELHPWAKEAWPTTKPDSTKLWRSTEDALRGVIFHDDAQIVLQIVSKQYDEGGGLGARITISRMGPCQTSLLAEGGE